MSQTISAIASLLWPLIVLAVLVLFRGPLTRVIRSTEKRDFTIQVAGQSVSVGELHRQQMDMMADLHDQVTALRKDVDALRVAGPGRIPGAGRVAADIPVAVAASSYGANVASNGPANDTELTDVDVPSPARPLLPADMAKAPWERLELPAQDQDPVDEPAAPQAGLSVVPGPDDLPAWTAARPDTRPKPAGVLWVDDEPAHNALQLDQLERRGIVVDTARSTREAVQKLTGQRYQIIVSDMERVEGGKPVPNAGLELIRTVRTFDRETPVVIYSSGPAGKILGDTAAQIGADLVTSSWYQLSQELRRVGVL